MTADDETSKSSDGLLTGVGTMAEPSRVGAPPPKEMARTLRSQTFREDLPLLGERYRVLGMLGGGGMGNVYLAHDTELDEKVAVKLLKASLSKSKEQIELLRREVKFGRKVTHPNVLRTFDIGDHDGAKFITMELVEGVTLADVLHGARTAAATTPTAPLTTTILTTTTIPLTEVARIARAICAGLGAAHDVGILHRDLKPSNVMLSDDGRILLSDFGIALLARDADDVELAGTPGYIPPELLANEHVDLRADIWALGVLLFELLVGERPYPSRRADILRPLVDPAPDPHERRPELPLALARVVTRCMARQPQARFGHPGEVLAALDAALPSPAISSERRVGVAIAGASPPAATGSGLANVLAAARRVRVLAVIPLVNLGSVDDGHLAEGFTALLIDGLASTRMRVPSRGAVEATHPGGRDALAVARDLGAEAVVTGSVNRFAQNAETNANASANHLTIHLKVTGTGDGLVLFDEEIVVPIADLVSAAENASRAIASTLLVERRDETTGLHDGQAIDLYLKGMQEYRRRWGNPVARSVHYFRKALERAPDDPMITAAYSLALTRALSFGSSSAEAANEARAMAWRALSLARDRPESHLAVAAVSLQVADNVEAARSLRNVMQLAPHDPDAQHYRGLLISEVIGAAEGLAHFYTALTLDPTQTHLKWWIARAYALLRDFARCDEIFATPPTDEIALNEYWASRTRTLLYQPTPKRMSLYLADFKTSPAFEAKPSIEAALALRRGEKLGPSGLGMLVERKQYVAKRSASYMATLKAEVAGSMSDVDTVMWAITEADAEGFIDIVWLDQCPVLESVRTRTDYKKIRAQVAERAAAVREVLLSALIFAGIASVDSQLSQPARDGTRRTLE